MIIVDIVVAVAAVGALWGAAGFRVIRQFERGVVFRFGKVSEQVRGPGLARIQPGIDRMRKVNMQIITMPVPAQDGITRDNVTVRVDAVVYFRVVDPVRAVVDVQNYTAAIAQVAQTSLRSIIGKSDLDDLLSNRERLNQGLELMLDSPALGWGVHIDRVEIKDVALPESMKRSMSRQAEAERERRARVISADGELQASEKLASAAATMSRSPAALQLRLLETVVEVAAEKNSTLVLPFPVELLRFLETSTRSLNSEAGDTMTPTDERPDHERPSTDRPDAGGLPAGRLPGERLSAERLSAERLPAERLPAEPPDAEPPDAEPPDAGRPEGAVPAQRTAKPDTVAQLGAAAELDTVARRDTEAVPEHNGHGAPPR